MLASADRSAGAGAGINGFGCLCFLIIAAIPSYSLLPFLLLYVVSYFFTYFFPYFNKSPPTTITNFGCPKPLTPRYRPRPRARMA